MVSAVGRGFTTVDDNGIVHKCPGAQAAPFNVEIPFSTVVPDLFDLVERRLDAELRDQTVRTTSTGRRTSSLDLLAFLARAVVRTVFRQRDSWSDDLGAMFDDDLTATDGRRAQQTLLNRLRSVIAAFETQFPDAVITQHTSDDPAQTERQ